MNDALLKITNKKFDAITLFRENHTDITKALSGYLESPKHILLNLAPLDSPTDELLDLINFVSTILKSSSYSLQVFDADQKVLNKLSDHRYRNILPATDMIKYITLLDNIERELRVESLLKCYVDETMKYFFSKKGIILKRGELSLDDSPQTFLNQMNYFQTFELSNSFFSFVIGGAESFFEDFIQEMGEKELSPIFSAITGNIPSKYFEDVKLHDYLAHPYNKFPSEKIEVAGSAHHHFQNCVVMKIPLEFNSKTFYLEVWIPKVFSKEVFNFLNP
ncbi:hypothetical protein [Bacteriovorax sp. Seq25_V]|uniref:hypothetical protein n=1 Tax=Bacteriovorax sp. Seq25_V TaxID=1201288 RepID=UPI000389FC00|nr:hypothetical protein [Bacteriovorax sp. Seq25_V]EQC46917.1 hypothetical protein M900_2596 [Bacteriovorax sp. Seq25_V]